MEYEICRLGVSDFHEAIDFINMVFSMQDAPTDFIELLPVYYQPTEEHMKCHHVIKIDGKIRALVGIYPGKLETCDTSLKVARIGAVSVHPYYREQGLMKKLLSHCIDLIKEEGYDLGVLGGLRHRYLYFGYEKCGCRLMYHINKSNIKHYRIGFDDIEIKPEFSENKAFIEYCKALHDKQEMHFLRSQEDFYNICLSWKNRLNGIYKGGIPVGYLVCSLLGDYISEIHTESAELFLKAVAAFTAQSTNDAVSISISHLDLELNQSMGKLSESPEIQGVENWCVYDWERVMVSLLNIKNKIAPLQEGKVVIGIKDYGNLCITVRDGAALCSKTQEAAVLKVDAATAMRMLFGPLPPSFVVDLPKEALILNSWCPLPLYISAQDCA